MRHVHASSSACCRSGTEADLGIGGASRVNPAIGGSEMQGHPAGCRGRLELPDRGKTGLSRPTVIATRATFAQGGIEAIRRKQTRKRSRRVRTPELEKRILDTTLQTRPPDATHWSVRTLARHLGVTRTVVHEVWQKYDVQPHRVERFKLSNDPRFEEKVRDIVGLYLNPPDRALVLCVDEKSQIQALDRT